VNSYWFPLLKILAIMIAIICYEVALVNVQVLSNMFLSMFLML
jgi:hypothetical protein